MQISIKPWMTSLQRDSVGYLLTVDKDDGRNNEYVVEITRLHAALFPLFENDWPKAWLENGCWMVSFYTLDSLFSLQPSARYQPDRRMAFTRSELATFLLQGPGQVMMDFMRRQPQATLVAIAIREGLGRMYHQLLTRHAAQSGLIYNQTWTQEAVYVVEKRRKSYSHAANQPWQATAGGRYRRCQSHYASTGRSAAQGVPQAWNVRHARTSALPVAA